MNQNKDEKQMKRKQICVTYQGTRKEREVGSNHRRKLHSCKVGRTMEARREREKEMGRGVSNSKEIERVCFVEREGAKAGTVQITRSTKTA